MVNLSRKNQINKIGPVVTAILVSISIMVLTSCSTMDNDASATSDSAVQVKSPLDLATHQQLVLVISDNWQADNALLYRFDKRAGKWLQKDSQIPVTLGRTGLAWGIGLHDKQVGQVKKEGDGKAPAGIFTLGDAFGYLTQLNTKLTYQKMSVNDFCIDVNDSSYYNQIVSKLEVGEQGIKGSSEPMRRDIHLAGDHKYKKGLIVQHNSGNISGAGSCIFMHIWQAPTLATAGCTAMGEDNITDLLAWLTEEKQPLYVALPRAEYLAKKLAWALPDLPNLQEIKPKL